jgi:hypothetical protein
VGAVAAEKVAAGAVATAGVEGAVVAGADLGPAAADLAADSAGGGAPAAAGSAGPRCPVGPRTLRQATAAVHMASRAATQSPTI